MAETRVGATQGRGKAYVRTFLFSMRVDAPLNRLHVLTKFSGILLISLVLVRVMDEHRPDPAMAGLLLGLALLAMVLGGVSRWLFRSYLVVILPMFLFLLLTWIAFTPDLGTLTYLRLPIYSGAISLGISLSGLVWLVIVLGYFAITRKLFPGVVLGTAAALAIARLTADPGLRLATYRFLAPYTFVVSDANLLVAGTKVLGYAAMVLASLLLVMTTRDAELVAALRQLRLPYLARFFLSIVFRTLGLSLLDYETIRQAQVARGIRMRRQSLLGVLRHIALMSVPMVATMLRRASEIGDALQARGFALGRPGRDFVEVRRFGLLDVLALVLLVGLAGLVFGAAFNLTAWLQGIVA